MTQAITGGLAGRWGFGVDPQPAAPPPDTEALHGEYRVPPYPVPLPPLPRAAVAPVTPATDAERDAQVQEGLDAFRLAMNPAYRVPDALPRPGTTFQMSDPYETQRATIQANQAAVAKAAAAARLSGDDLRLVLSGRGSPHSLQALTQALIDAGRVPSTVDGGPRLEPRIRQMMFDCGIGIDCAGYVQQAYLRTMGVSASAAGWRARTNEDLSNLGARGFVRIGDLARVRPGDIVVLGPPPKQPGHRAIVYEQHVATESDLAELRERSGASRAFASTPPIRLLSVDSSWGSSGHAEFGGVRRETWWYSASTGQWAWLDQGDDRSRAFRTAGTPMDHPFGEPFGIYRGARTLRALPGRRSIGPMITERLVLPGARGTYRRGQ
jgi:cell wall-associated NlpC family hydrolase